MFKLHKTTTVAAVICLAAGGLVLTGATPASAATGPPQPYNEPSEGISVPIFGLIAIAGIATIAIWQGVRDAKKKKEAQQEKEQELEEQEEFEEYFDFGSAEPGAPGTADADETTGATETAATSAGAE
jgi:hypothetical protein